MVSLPASPKMTINKDVITLSSPLLLEKIDKLRDLNIGQHVPLPQLVVVGDQSSGKSSLLESLSGIPFPKGQSLCTRHATQISSRRTSSEYVNACIIPGPRASEEHRKHVEAFRPRLASLSEFRKQFADILNKANERMGLRTDMSSTDGSVFSEDILKIETCGPHEDYLTIIDVPGIFRATTEGTTKDDMVMVKGLVKEYIKDHRTIILAVLPSNVDIATQEILELAEEYDKKGERTLGVLTKPDLVIEPGAQAIVCDLVQGRKRPLSLGYFLVQNRGADSGFVEQSELDRFSRIQPWNHLPQDRVGVAALREQLGSLLLEISWRELPHLLQDVNQQMREFKKDLNSLGPPRQHERQQRSALSQIAGAFQDRVRAALTADYNADPFFSQDELRLITHVVNITEVFSDDFHRGAHSRYFENVQSADAIATAEMPKDDDGDAEDNDGDFEDTSSESLISNLRVLLKRARLDDVTVEEHAELGDIIATPHQRPVPHGEVTEWINDNYLQFRGLELGTCNANFVSMVFAEQSRNWGDMTKVYMSRIIIIIHRFIAAALRSVCPEEQARSQVWSAILESLVNCYRMAMNQANLLVQVEQRQQPYTLNRQFNQALSKARGYRLTELLRSKARRDTKQYGGAQFMVNLDAIVEAVEEKGNVEQLQEEIHDILQAYYGLALDRFLDNVFQLAVGQSLLHGPESPLKVFTQDWVINLEAEQLERIVGETKSAKKRRQKLERQIDDLTNAWNILRT